MIVVLSKLISAFLLPPGIFVLLFGWLAWLLQPKTTGFMGTGNRHEVKGARSLWESFSETGQPLNNVDMRKRWTPPFFLACGGAMFLYLFSIEPISDMFLKPLEDRYLPLSEKIIEGILKEETPVDAVVVLGGGTVAKSPEKGSDDIREEPIKRLLHGVRIYREVKKTLNPALLLILSGGRVFDVGQEAEATLMKHYALEWGVDPELILLEPDSHTTWQNARNVVTRFHPKKIILITSAYHMPRAVWCFSRQSVEVIPAPTDYKVNRGVPYDLESFLPTLNGFQHTRKALHEYLGLLLYWIAYQ